jgi:hypothetical protein
MLVGAHEDEGMPVLGRRDAGRHVEQRERDRRRAPLATSAVASTRGSKRSKV